MASRWNRGDGGVLELGVDGGRGEALPDDRLADCLNEEIDAGALLLQLVLEEYDETGHEQLKYVSLIYRFPFLVLMIPMKDNLNFETIRCHLMKSPG